ncbi:MAG: aspartate-semialdehyde dehydrogenase, partial [Dehalococcoidia bacterium]
MSKLYNVAVVGATGLVGQEFLRIAMQRGFPIKALRLLASSRSAGRRVTVGEWELEVEETTSKSFAGVDVAFFSATTEVSQQLIPAAVKAGAVVIDDSAAWRMEPDVPLVVPEVNADDLDGHKGITAIPNCPTTPLVVTLWPIHRINPVKRIIVDTYQSVSGHGGQAVQELSVQARAVLDGNSASAHVFPHQIAFNLLPQVDVFLGSGYTKEEWKVINETKKIMHEPEMAVS